MKVVNSIKKKSADFNVSKHSYIILGLFSAIIFVGSLLLFNFVSYIAMGVALIIAVFSAGISAALCVVLICVRYSLAFKIKNPADASNKNAIFYIKRMLYTVFMIILMSVAASLIGTFINGLFGGIVMKNVNNAFLSGVIVKLPIFVLYLSFVYKMLIRYGFVDCGKKMHNINFKMLSVIIALMLMLPMAIHGSMYFTSLAETSILNVQTVFSPNVDKYVMSDDIYKDEIIPNEDFNIFLVFLSTAVAFAAQFGVFWFAYRRGKQIFMKERIRILDEYEIDENV